MLNKKPSSKMWPAIRKAAAKDAHFHHPVGPIRCSSLYHFCLGMKTTTSSGNSSFPHIFFPILRKLTILDDADATMCINQERSPFGMQSTSRDYKIGAASHATASHAPRGTMECHISCMPAATIQKVILSSMTVRDDQWKDAESIQPFKQQQPGFATRALLMRRRPIIGREHCPQRTVLVRYKFVGGHHEKIRRVD
jgi:hypothetical protein